MNEREEQTLQTQDRFWKGEVFSMSNVHKFESVAGQIDDIPKYDKKKLFGERVEIETDLCKGCALCTEACPPNVLKISAGLNKMGYHPVEYVGEGCTGCGVCFYVCPEPGAIRVYKRVN